MENERDLVSATILLHSCDMLIIQFGKIIGQTLYKHNCAAICKDNLVKEMQKHL